MERVGEAIAAVDRLAEPLLHRLQCSEADIGREHQRASGRTWHHRSIDCVAARRTAPRLVPLGAIRARDAPEVLRVSRKFGCEIDAELAVRTRGGYGVLEPVHLCAAVFPAAPKIHEHVRILVRE